MIRLLYSMTFLFRLQKISLIILLLILFNSSIILLLILFNSSVFADYKLITGNYIIYADEKDSLIVKFLEECLNDVQFRFEIFFSHKLNDTVTIKLAATENEYRRETAGQVPEWSSGVAFVNAKKIILKPGSFFNPALYRQILLHEVAHIFLTDKLKQETIPLWLNEGIAMYLSRDQISWAESITLGNAIAAGKIINLTEIESLQTFGNIQADIAYLESFLAVEYLIINYGEDSIKKIINELNDQKLFVDAFKNITGIDLIDFEFEWYDYLKKRYRWMVILQFENILWISFIFIIIIAFLLMKWRNRKIIKEWEESEQS